MTRVGFDGLETFQNRSASWLVAPYAIGEGTPSVLAQKLGFQIGKALNASEGIGLPSNNTVQRFGEY
ncbi:hypothetical protein [Aquimarina algicola]|uniref:Uncharacterized protein n=1 Tax=Aquimarina algicola TaxID=2589995 RepID=A0A504JIE3_9FLAO|nr:hypothetical protein [Aquimarina algicola]TPN87383.1 hypothetical protein FHK87_07300 [Aquimarina algicola]